MSDGIVSYEPSDVVARRVVANVAVGFYANSCIVALFLAGFKFAGAISAGWQWVTMPVWLPPLVGALMFIGFVENIPNIARRKMRELQQ